MVKYVLNNAKKLVIVLIQIIVNNGICRSCNIKHCIYTSKTSC